MTGSPPAQPAAPVTIGSLLSSSTARLREAGSDTARLDAEVLLAHVLRIDRAGLLAHPNSPVGPEHAAAFEEAVERRGLGEPVAYIRGMKEFYGLAFMVDARALIPRPETELLVELALERIRELLTSRPRPAGGPPLRAWDVGTGSGAVAVSLAVEGRRHGYSADVQIMATDISPDALALATENAVAHGVADQIDFAVADLLDLPGAPRVDLVLANLPYVPSALVPGLPIAARYEPAAALDGGADGLDHIRRLLGQLPGALADDGAALLEIGSDHPEAVRQSAAATLPGWALSIHEDLGGLPRVAELRPH